MADNDNREPMSPLGRMIFDMMNAHNQVYFSAQRVREMAPRSMHNPRPTVTETIKRPSQKETT